MCSRIFHCVPYITLVPIVTLYSKALTPKPTTGHHIMSLQPYPYESNRKSLLYVCIALYFFFSITLASSLTHFFCSLAYEVLDDYTKFWQTITVEKIIATTRFNNAIYDFCTEAGLEEHKAMRKFIYMRCCNLVRLNKLVIGQFSIEKLCKVAYNGLMNDRQRVMENYRLKYEIPTVDDIDMPSFEHYFEHLLNDYLARIDHEKPQTYEI